jgi:hypothetical protein
LVNLGHHQQSLLIILSKSTRISGQTLVK